jgi:predicted transcriptional regulator
MADPIAVLRDRTENTRLLVLAGLETEPGATLSGIAARLGVTVQAVSAHARALAEHGLLEAEPTGYRPTAKGRQALHEGVRRLRDAVAALAAPLDVIQLASAVAAHPIQRGQAVGLWMSDGDLEARPLGKGPQPSSRGVARNDAAAGDEVVVEQLKGIVRLEPGHLRLITLPAPAEGGIARVDVPRLATMLPDGRLGAHGTGARILARKLAAAGRRLDFEFAADQAAFNAAERGLPAVLLVSRDRLPEVMEALERLNAATLNRVPVEIVEAPERLD